MNEITKKALGAMLAVQRYPWEQGVAAQAAYEAGLESLWGAMAHEAIVRSAPDGRLAVNNKNVAVTDPAANGEVCWRAWELTGDTFYRDGAQKMYDYLMNAAPRTPDGILYHNNVSWEDEFSSAQLWVDSCFMAPPFLAVMGNVDEAVHQLRGMFRYLQCKETKILFHNYDVGTGRFVRRLRWATGNGWALMGLARVAAEAKKRDLQEYYKELTAMGNELLDAMLRYQLPDGRFYDIMDDETTFVEGTASMMMSVYIYRGVLEGWLDKKYIEPAERAFASVTANIDQFGILRHVCGCPGFTDEGTSCEAQASYVMASVWREKALAAVEK